MVNKVLKLTIERELEHKACFVNGVFLILTVTEFVHSIDELGQKTKYATTNVSLINDYTGYNDDELATISKISGLGKTCEGAYRNCIDRLNHNRDYYTHDNKQLLCCSEIPIFSIDDFQDFRLTRTIVISWEVNEHEKKSNIMKIYIKNTPDGLQYTYDGTEDTFDASSDKEILERVFQEFDFSKSPNPTSIRRRGRNFYPTLSQFIR